MHTPGFELAPNALAKPQIARWSIVAFGCPVDRQVLRRSIILILGPVSPEKSVGMGALRPDLVAMSGLGNLMTAYVSGGAVGRGSLS